MERRGAAAAIAQTRTAGAAGNGVDCPSPCMAASRPVDARPYGFAQEPRFTCLGALRGYSSVASGLLAALAVLAVPVEMETTDWALRILSALGIGTASTCQHLFACAVA
ncbi:uncharacterized protein PHACADRAFT_259130 [Phanerochaete carnosa HHB-10118-sp]|uniref:Uncharacterized protein n=1 Tax=Phanerochaete carnosa (strain HHB-10118-sp) TaxID=650164 RepID=K5W244_PHACS|nr:uncharacterized protein PHACADRAFT_259130 [Phanerochaete carnosa HHB-10118-sp]EKM52959.1 hypothetical protein PHACADRAFT_259130 [Phanerochaete carnosa HHB-10118-sp]